MGFPIIPAVVGAGKVGKSILDANVKRAGQATKFDKYVEKYFARPLRSRGPFPEEQFQGMQRLEGKKSSANLLSTDYCSDLDNCCNKNLRLEKKTRKAPYKHIDMIFELFYLLW